MSYEVKFDFSGLKLSTKPMTIRIPISMMGELKRLANKLDSLPIDGKDDASESN